MSSSSAIVYLNGRFLRAGDARISALDRGLLYGDGLFETLRTYSGRPFALAEHLERMRAGTGRLRLPPPKDVDWWQRVITALLGRNRLGSKDAAIRITVTRGVGGRGLLPPARPRTTVLVTARPLPARLPEWQRRGVKVTLLPFHAGRGGYLAAVKTIDYLTALLGKQIANERGAFEGIYRTERGTILEGTTSNVFVVRGRVVDTTPVADGVLPGVTRERLIGIARAAGLRVRERSVRCDELFGADEAFLTASTIEVVPIREIDGKPIGRGGFEVARSLLRGFQRSVESA